jgi:hypothetical protein
MVPTGNSSTNEGEIKNPPGGAAAFSVISTI